MVVYDSAGRHYDTARPLNDDDNDDGTNDENSEEDQTTEMKFFDGTKHEELAVLRFLLPKDPDNSFRGPMYINLQQFQQFQPRCGLSDAVYKDMIPLLYNRSMDDDFNIYASIQDLLDAVFLHAVDTTDRRHPARPKTAGRYVYTPALADYLLLAFK